MKLSELHRILSLHLRPEQPHLDADVCVVVKMPYTTVGAKPMVKIRAAAAGFDWENGKFMLWPEEDLQPADRDFEEQFKKLQKDYGWLDYENRNLKSEINKLKGKLK